MHSHFFFPAYVVVDKTNKHHFLPLKKKQKKLSNYCIHIDAFSRSNFAGLVLAAEEGKQIAASLGGKKAALLGNHGLLTAAATIEATISWFVLLERCCQVQLAADASSAGTGRPLVVIGEEEARSSWEAIGQSEHGYFQGLPLFQVAEGEFGERTYLGRGLDPI